MQVLSRSSQNSRIEACRKPARLHVLCDIWVNYPLENFRYGSSNHRSCPVDAGFESQGTNLIVTVGSLPGLNSIKLTNLPLQISRETKVVLTQVFEDLQILVASPSDNLFEVLKISINGFKNWVERLGLGAEELLREQIVTHCVSHVMSVSGQLIDLSPAPGDYAVVTSVVEINNGKKKVVCSLVDFENEAVSDIFSAEVNKDTPFQAQVLGSGLLIRNNTELSYLPSLLAGPQQATHTSLLAGTQEATNTWQSVELFQRVSFNSFICISRQSNLSRKLLHIYMAKNRFKVDEFDVTAWLRYTNRIAACRSDMTQEGIKITLLTVEKLGLVKRVCKILNSRVTPEEIRVIKKGQLSPGDEEYYTLRAGGVVEEQQSQLALF